MQKSSSDVPAGRLFRLWPLTSSETSAGKVTGSTSNWSVFPSGTWWLLRSLEVTTDLHMTCRRLMMRSRLVMSLSKGYKEDKKQHNNQIDIKKRKKHNTILHQYSRKKLLYFVSPREWLWRQRVFQRKTLVTAREAGVFSQAFKKEHHKFDVICAYRIIAFIITASIIFKKEISFGDFKASKKRGFV